MSDFYQNFWVLGSFLLPGKKNARSTDPTWQVRLPVKHFCFVLFWFFPQGLIYARHAGLKHVHSFILQENMWASIEVAAKLLVCIIEACYDVMSILKVV